MEAFLKSLFLNNIQRKLVSLIVAVAVWCIVSASIVSTHTFLKIPVRIVNMPANKTIRGMSPDGLLEKKISVTLTGETAFIERLTASSFEVVLDAANKGDEWTVKITPKNLVCYDSDLEISSSNKIQQVIHNELVVHLSHLVTAKIPVSIVIAKNSPPEGYQLLDVWPRKLFHTVTGVEEDVKKLEEDGLVLTIDESMISKEELDAARMEANCDEVSFLVPDSWKKVRIPILKGQVQTLNCPEAKALVVRFLATDCLPIQNAIPVRLFYPMAMLDVFSPGRVQLAPMGKLRLSNGACIIEDRLYTQEVSSLFLDLVREHIEIVVVPRMGDRGIFFHCEVQLVDIQSLEDAYVARAYSVEEESGCSHNRHSHSVAREQYLRLRFRDYAHRLKLYSAKDRPLVLEASMKDGKVIVQEVR